MDGDDFDNVQLVSLSEIIEVYYQLFKSEMELSAPETKGKNGYHGSLLDQSAVNLAEFAERNQIPSFSQTLAELLTLLEWQNEKKVPEIQDTAIYNALLRVEKAANNTSTWELYGKEDDGPLIALSSFETNMLEQTISMYIMDVLNKRTSQALFFPLTDLYQSDILIKWRILEKIASIKVTPHQTIYKHKLTDCMTRRIQDEVSKWLSKEFQKLKLSGKNTVLKDAETLTKILKDLKSNVTVAIDVNTMHGTLFREASCSYFDCLSKALDTKLLPVCLQIMESMDTYQENHKSFHVNLRDSCALSYSLYVQVKELVHCLQTMRKTPQTWKLDDYSSMFLKFFMNLLQVMKSECHNRIKRAVETETKDSVHTEEKVHSSSVIVLNCICTVIDEWKHIEIENEDLQTAFLVKISDSICDGAKIFAEALDHRLSKDKELCKDFEFTKKICILANSVEHVRKYLEDLPRQMLWRESLRKSSEDSEFCSETESVESGISEQVLRILNLVHQSMDSHMRGIVVSMLKTAVTSLQTQCEKLLSAWIQSVNPNQTFDRFFHCFNEYLEWIHDSLREDLFPQFLSQLWLSILLYIQNEFQEGLPPDYAKSLKQNISNLMDYLVYIKMEESETHKPLLQQMVSILDLNSKTTVDLQLDYFSQVAESIVSPVEYLGHIAFQAGYKVIGEDLIDLYINIQKGQRIPAVKCEMNELYVKLELFPGSMFPNQIALKSTPVSEDLDNPVFNQFFQFSNLPLDVLSVKGAVIQVLVLNETKSFSAEAVLLLNQVQNMSGFSSLEFLPVYLMALRKFDMSQVSYQVLENRSRWDKNAKMFIKSRKKLVKNQKKFLTCIPGTMSCSF